MAGWWAAICLGTFFFPSCQTVPFLLILFPIFWACEVLRAFLRFLNPFPLFMECAMLSYSMHGDGVDSHLVYLIPFPYVSQFAFIRRFPLLSTSHFSPLDLIQAVVIYLTYSCLCLLACTCFSFWMYHICYLYQRFRSLKYGCT